VEDVVKKMVEAGVCPKGMEQVVKKALNGKKEIPSEFGTMFNDILNNANKAEGGLSIPGFEGNFLDEFKVPQVMDMSINSVDGDSGSTSTPLTISDKYGRLIKRALNETIDYKNQGVFEKETLENEDSILDLTQEYCNDVIKYIREHPVILTEEEKSSLRSLVNKTNVYENGDPNTGIDSNGMGTGELQYNDDMYKKYRQEIAMSSNEILPSENPEDPENPENPTNPPSTGMSLRDMIVVALIFGRN